MPHHTYILRLSWTGNLGEGTSTYRSYSRGHTIEIPGKPLLLGSADPAFRGDPTCYNPEELFVSSLAACHMLWYLHLCAEAGVVVVRYDDAPVGIMQETATGGHFTQVTLKPTVAIAAGQSETIAIDSDLKKAYVLHTDAHAACFIANSVNFPVLCEPSIVVGGPADT